MANGGLFKVLTRSHSSFIRMPVKQYGSTARCQPNIRIVSEEQPK